MKKQKFCLRPLVLAAGAFVSTGLWAQSVVFTNTAGGQQVLGDSYVKVYDYPTRTETTLTESGLRVLDYLNFSTTGTSVTASGVTTNALAANANATLAITGNVDFTGANVMGLGGMFDPANAGALAGVTSLNAGANYNMNLSTGATTLGAVNASSLTTTGDASVGGNAGVIGNATIGGTLAVTGVTTTNGINNTGNIATSTLSTAGLATLDSAAITNDATVGGALTVTGATTLNGATTVQNTLNVNGVTTVVGTTNINTSGSAATSIGNASAPVTLSGSAVTVTGGSTRMVLDNNGVVFSNAATGGPARLSGVANGSGEFDAVNVRQFGSAIAGATAAANIPGVDSNKTSSVGVGLGSFMNQQALALGGSYRFSDNGVLRASVATGLNAGGSKTSVGVGAAWSW